jgi:hypothetical protein
MCLYRRLSLPQTSAPRRKKEDCLPIDFRERSSAEQSSLGSDLDLSEVDDVDRLSASHLIQCLGESRGDMNREVDPNERGSDIGDTVVGWLLVAGVRVTLSGIGCDMR